LEPRHRDDQSIREDSGDEFHDLILVEQTPSAIRILLYNSAAVRFGNLISRVRYRTLLRSTVFAFHRAVWQVDSAGKNGGGRGQMDGIYAWQQAYLAAVCETDDAKMMGRILEARAAIEQRLLVPIEEDSVEHRDLLAAQKALEVLKSERVQRV
jgi:hypothetical protein